MKQNTTIRQVACASFLGLFIFTFHAAAAMEFSESGAETVVPTERLRTSANYQDMFQKFKESAVRMRAEVDRRMEQSKKSEEVVAGMAKTIAEAEVTVKNKKPIPGKLTEAANLLKNNKNFSLNDNHLQEILSWNLDYYSKTTTQLAKEIYLLSRLKPLFYYQFQCPLNGNDVTTILFWSLDYSKTTTQLVEEINLIFKLINAFPNKFGWGLSNDDINKIFSWNLLKSWTDDHATNPGKALPNEVLEEIYLMLQLPGGKDYSSVLTPDEIATGKRLLEYDLNYRYITLSKKKRQVTKEQIQASLKLRGLLAQIRKQGDLIGNWGSQEGFYSLDAADAWVYLDNLLKKEEKFDIEKLASSGKTNIQGFGLYSVIYYMIPKVIKFKEQGISQPTLAGISNALVKEIQEAIPQEEWEKLLAVSRENLVQNLGVDEPKNYQIADGALAHHWLGHPPTKEEWAILRRGWVWIDYYAASKPERADRVKALIHLESLGIEDPAWSMGAFMMKLMQENQILTTKEDLVKIAFHETFGWNLDADDLKVIASWNLDLSIYSPDMLSAVIGLRLMLPSEEKEEYSTVTWDNLKEIKEGVRLLKAEKARKPITREQIKASLDAGRTMTNLLNPGGRADETKHQVHLKNLEEVDAWIYLEDILKKDENKDSVIARDICGLVRNKGLKIGIDRIIKEFIPQIIKLRQQKPEPMLEEISPDLLVR